MFCFFCPCFKKSNGKEAKQADNQDFDLNTLPGPRNEVVRTYSESSVYSLKSTTSVFVVWSRFKQYLRNKRRLVCKIVKYRNYSKKKRESTTRSFAITINLEKCFRNIKDKQDH
ncbi:hypothetical protein Trydic_g22140 [Trypoxylus dichotomus]